MAGSALVPVLETPRLRLRGHDRRDLDDCAAMWADPAVVAHISGTPSTRSEAWARLLRYTGHWAHLGFGYWVVERREDGRYLGEVGFADFQRDTDPTLRDTPEAGWVLARHAHGQGIATEAVTCILGWADRTLAAERTACMIAPAHEASIHVARKVGYGDVVAGSYAGDPALFFYRNRR